MWILWSLEVLSPPYGTSQSAGKCSHDFYNSRVLFVPSLGLKNFFFPYLFPLLLALVWMFCVSSKLIWWNLNPQGDGIRRWALWEVIRYNEGRVLMNGISAPIKMVKRTPLCLVPYEVTAEKWPSMKQEWTLTRYSVCWHLDRSRILLKIQRKWKNMLQLLPNLEKVKFPCEILEVKWKLLDAKVPALFST